MDISATLEIIDEALAAIDEFDAVYRVASDGEGETFRRAWDESLDIEQTRVKPALELARQIAAHSARVTCRSQASPTRRCTTRIPSRRTPVSPRPVARDLAPG